jgi:hypothetical protein
VFRPSLTSLVVLYFGSLLMMASISFALPFGAVINYFILFLKLLRSFKELQLNLTLKLCDAGYSKNVLLRACISLCN